MMNRIKEQHIRWVGIPIAGVIIQWFMGDHMERPYIMNLAITTLFTAIYWNGCVLIMRHWRRKYHAIENTPLRLSLTIASLFAFIMLGGVVIKLALGLIDVREIQDLSAVFSFADASLIACLVVGMGYESGYFFGK